MSQTQNGRAQEEGDSRKTERWFATFTFLDASCAISASQFERLVALLSKSWRGSTVLAV